METGEQEGCGKGEREVPLTANGSRYKPALKGFQSYFTIHRLHYPRLIWPACPSPKRDRKKQLRARCSRESEEDSGTEKGRRKEEVDVKKV